jgi:DNA-directed RNA polymerase specialized sigma24 family protein
MNPSDRVWRERGLRSAVLAGDERAWQSWYEESFHGLTAYVAWRCAGLQDLAEEVVQETWLTAVRRIRSFDLRSGDPKHRQRRRTAQRPHVGSLPGPTRADVLGLHPHR